MKSPDGSEWVDVAGKRISQNALYYLGVTKEKYEEGLRDYPKLLGAWKQICGCGNDGPCDAPCKCFWKIVEAIK